MKGQHVTEHLTAYVSGELEEPLSRQVKEHLAGCETCRQEFQAVARMWENLARLPGEQPSEAMSEGFYNVLRGYEEAARQTQESAARPRKRHRFIPLWPGSPAFQGGLAIVMLAIGFLGGLVFTAGGHDAREIAQLRNEVRQLGSLLTVSLLQQGSASERLKGVSWSQRMGDDDTGIVDALIRTMKYDPNVNVRLAALDVLARDLRHARVREEILQAFPGQSSPLMQAALVDLFVQINDRDSRAALQQALKTPGLNPEVQKRIQQGMQILL